MEVFKVVCTDGTTFFTNRRSDVANAFDRPEIESVTRLTMTDEQYAAIPASADSAAFFG